MTGGNRGIGFAVCNGLARLGLQVVLTARDETKGNEAIRAFNAAHKDLHGGLEGRLSFFRLDVTDTENIRSLRAHLESRFGRLDVLVNNAGVFLDDKPALEESVETIRRTMETNVYGPFQLCQQLAPLMKKKGYGRIVNVSSGMGQLTEMNGGYPGYRISKTGLNVVTRIFSEELKGTDILVNSICPGWVKTEMGGSSAERTPEEGADTIIWAATLPSGGPTGGFFRDRQRIPW